MFEYNNEYNVMMGMKCFEPPHLPVWSTRNLICILNDLYIKSDCQMQLLS